MIGAVSRFRFAPDPGAPAAGAPAPTPPAPAGGKSVEDQIKELQSQLSERDRKIAELSKSGGSGDDPDLTDRVRKDREDKAKKDSDSKSIETALTFTLKSDNFLKENESILPSDASEIFKAAESEKYDSPVQKANAIKAGLIKSFFSVQANIDTLTSSQKTSLEDYLKLSKNGKEEKAQQVFENILEPALELSKRMKKAEELQRARNGFGTSSDQAKAYKEKLLTLAKKRFFKAAK